jgi:hypothetical protein
MGIEDDHDGPPLIQSVAVLCKWPDHEARKNKNPKNLWFRVFVLSCLRDSKSAKASNKLNLRGVIPVLGSMNQLKEYTADHRYLLDIVARKAGFADPVAFEPDQFCFPLLKASRKGKLLPLEGVMVRDWDPDNRKSDAGVELGARLYEIESVRFVVVHMDLDQHAAIAATDFFVVDRKNYRRLYKIALHCRRDSEPASKPPILPAEHMGILWENTIRFLDSRNLRRIKAYGGRARRGLLLTGPPGNGKTMACRWIWEACRRRHWDWRLVTPSLYRQARASDDAEEAIRALFNLERRGVVFFDDMDIALRDRETGAESDDQAVFLTALDGITIAEGIVYVFTTNCKLDLIDRAFKRPGRIDLVMHFDVPDAGLRRRLLGSWHSDIQQQIPLDHAVAETEGLSFAEIEELKNLLIMHFVENGRWSWNWAQRQFALNREELASTHGGQVGFRMPEPARNGRNGRQEINER